MISLSPREQQVLAWMSEGYTDSQIANALFISERTVRFHLYEARLKLRASCRPTAVKRALQQGYSLDAPPLPVQTDR